MSEPTISDLDAAFMELKHWGRPVVGVYHNGQTYLILNEIKICPGLTGEIKGMGTSLSQAVYSALEQLRVVRATVPPIPRSGLEPSLQKEHSV